MKETLQNLRREAADLLEKKEVALVIGWEPGSDVARTTPFFAAAPDEASRLTWGPFCANGLVKYLLDYRYGAEKLAVAARGCDMRAVNRLVQDRQFPRERVVVLGLPCAGILDRAKVLPRFTPGAKLLEVADRGDTYLVRTDLDGEKAFPKAKFLEPRCLECEQNVPEGADRLLGPAVVSPALPGVDRFGDVAALEALDPAAKSAFWDRHFARCLRCYACRNICPACNCKECAFEQAVPGWQQDARWISKATTLSENYTVHLIRMFDVAGRCIDCGECERVCPVNIPLRKLYRKVLKDARELFAAPTPGKAPDAVLPMVTFAENDREEFM
ncbi:MAG: 4Fe-4S dicluster domain-containing protein [Bacillota bacterium]|nr:4Fe-4S dicluster domain-containing protein [Bacillota bacterium]